MNIRNDVCVSKGMQILKERYKGKPVWVAYDLNQRPVTFGGWIQTDVNIDFANAKKFIYSQIIKLDSISKFADLIGEDGQSASFLEKIVQNDRNMFFWIDLAKKWFSAKWMASCNEQL